MYILFFFLLIAVTTEAQKFSLLKLRPGDHRALVYLNKLALQDDKYKVSWGIFLFRAVEIAWHMMAP